MEVSLIIEAGKDIKSKILGLRKHLEGIDHEFVVTDRGTEYRKWLSQQGDIQVIFVPDRRDTENLSIDMARNSNLVTYSDGDWEHSEKITKPRVTRSAPRKKIDVVRVSKAKSNMKKKHVRKVIEENRMLHISSFPDNTSGITEGLETMGRVECFNWRERTNAVGRATMNKELLSKIVELRPGTIFMEECFTGDVLPITIEQAKRSMTVGVVNWCGDMRETIPESMLSMGRVVDWTLMSNERQVREMLKLSIHSAFMPAGCATDLYKRVDADREQFPEDIIFLGSGGRKFENSALREQVVTELRKLYGDRFAVYGRGWNKRRYPWVKGFIEPEAAEAIAYSSCKIAIGISAFNADGYTSARMWKAMSSGACYLPRRFNGIEKWFTQQQEAAWWNTPSELFSHIKYYLSRDDERVRVADAGMKAVRADHSWEQRMRSVMRLVNGRTIRTF